MNDFDYDDDQGGCVRGLALLLIFTASAVVSLWCVAWFVRWLVPGGE